jgi:hypothetical protein
MLTTAIFLPVFFGTLALVLALLIPFFLLPLKNDLAEIKECTKPIKQLDEEIHRLGLSEFARSFLQPGEHHSLPPEKALRKDELLNLARIHGLEPGEAEELKQLLNEEAASDFAAGLIGAIAAIGIIALIGAFINSLTRRQQP